MAPSTRKLTISSSTSELERARRFVEECARDAGLEEEAISEVSVAVDEACSNIIEHAYDGDESQEIYLTAKVSPPRLTVRIQDEGRPFRSELYREPDVRKLIENRRGGGLGVYLMRQLMDQVEYYSDGPVNTVQLTKR